MKYNYFISIFILTFFLTSLMGQTKITVPNKEQKEEPKTQSTSARPKAVFRGSTGSMGTEGFNNSRNQTIGGIGQEGRNPNSDGYEGNRGNSSGRPTVVSGNRKIEKAYSFTGDLDKATIYAIIKVNPGGRGTFVDFAKGSTSREAAYKMAIINYLPRIQFNITSEESVVTVRFTFSSEKDSYAYNKEFLEYTERIIQTFELLSSGKGGLGGFVPFYEAPNIYEDRTKDYSILEKKMSQLKLQVGAMKISFESNPNASPKDPFETTSQYNNRLQQLNEHYKQKYTEEVEPLETEIFTIMNQHYRSTESSLLLYHIDPNTYNADNAIWKIQAQAGNVRTSIDIKVEPTLAKLIWHNRSLIRVADFTDIFGNVTYTELGISEIKWKIYIKYNYGYPEKNNAKK